MFWFWWKTIPEKIKPTSIRVIDLAGLYYLLRKKFPEGQIYLSDRTYLLCNPQDIRKFLEQDATNKVKYVPEGYDCDDFSYRLMGQFSIEDWANLAFGIVWTDKHALNCFVTETDRVFFIEPQTDEILEDLKDWMGEKIRFVIM